ncbi:DHA2 family efflux MFS transporter permease subunit [Nocardioides sp. CER19]|uniref:DHA2 family efflux MFS transporter permease subunit n=1 Tax=Nocardioides sp. CER19 TaxID=3038538 RepID=UPI002446F046|nr:DHA2 family efflux MFS transporter permease subunit [Nocardioides sp. CER19]MDH2413174.1 DHA2 family efflux MFS transporter permease subunit [Nocardioides sp. CER19]
MNDKHARWLALYTLCLGNLMIVLDTNIVNVALPAIQGDLGFTPTALAWVVNAYMLTYGGFLLLGGRLGDLFGNRRVFLGAVVAFTLASVACGFAPSSGLLVAGRAVQGLGGAAVSAVALALIMGLFDDPAERTKAMAVYGFVMSGGGAIGVLLGGVLTGFLTWHWVFLVNVPIGVGVWLLGSRVLPRRRVAAVAPRLDVVGAVLVTTALVLLVYGVVGSALPYVAGGLALLAVFVAWEAHTDHPIVPLRLFRLRNLVVAQVVGALWAGAMFATFFLSSLYLQQVLEYDALAVGLAFLPTSVVMAVFSLRWSDKLVLRFGPKPPLVAGLVLVAAGLGLLARVPVDGGYLVDVLPAMLLTGIGAGVALNPVLIVAMSDAAPEEAGLASGLANTSFSMGGALGLAVLASAATWRSDALASSGVAHAAALTGGFQVAFGAGALFALAAAVVGGVLLRTPGAQPAAETEPEVEVAAA